MAKKFPFTRTISKQNVIALVFDKKTAEATNTNVMISPPITDKDKLEKAVAKKIDSDTLKFIQIVDVSVDEKLYGVTMEDFMRIAVELDPRTRNPPTTRYIKTRTPPITGNIKTRNPPTTGNIKTRNPPTTGNTNT